MPPQAVHSFLALAYATLALRLPPDEEPSTPELALLLSHRQSVGSTPKLLAKELARTLAKPSNADRTLALLGRELALSSSELLSIALTMAVDADFLAGRAVAYLQHPISGSRPTVGLLAESFRLLDSTSNSDTLAFYSSTAFEQGILVPLLDTVPVPERPVSVPTYLAAALCGRELPPPGVQLLQDPELDLPSGTRTACHRHAKALEQTLNTRLLLRSRNREEARSAAVEVARHLDCRVAWLESAQIPGLAVWLRLLKRLPLLTLTVAPGETKPVHPIPGHSGLILIATGLDGTIDVGGATLISWHLPAPDPSERLELWKKALPKTEGLEELAAKHRHGTHRILQLARLASHRAAIEELKAVDTGLLKRVAASGEGSGLDNLAQPLSAEVPDHSLILSPQLEREMAALLERCRHRDGLADRLGDSSRVRYNPGVRALFTGPSGTGKTLGACWIAARLSMPVYRVDLSSVTSKYIGETEKNLSQLLSLAEASEVVLLFDEADSLFGRRTDIRDSNDRFANAQTNFLLQRMESFEGIAILTSNSRSRFDSAFMRRLDVVIDFPQPSPSERRSLWEAHLGKPCLLRPQELNLLAGQCDFAGGQIRNVVLAAAVEARAAGKAIDLPCLLRALASEYRKAGKALPQALLPAAAPAA